jgi:phosphoglycerate kinase
MANTFLAAQGREMGESLVEEEAVEDARELLERAGDRIVLPSDLVVAPDPSAAASARPVGAGEVPADEMALDVGPSTREAFAGAVMDARTVFWNGPLGLFERPAFAEGTAAMARAAARAAREGAFVVVGGGDSARAVREAGVSEVLSHVSTGGGAALEYLDRGSLPAVEVLEDA